MGILDEYLTGTAGKAVVFSQWDRMTRLAAIELEQQDRFQNEATGSGEGYSRIPADNTEAVRQAMGILSQLLAGGALPK